MDTSDREEDLRACGIAESRLFDYLDGVLPPDQAGTFEAHCAGCPACQRDVVAYHELERELAALPAPAPRAGFDRAVLNAVRGGGFLPELGGQARVYVGGLAGVAAVVLVVLAVLAGRAGGWGELATLTISRVVHLGVNAVAGAVRDLLAAVRVSDVLLGVAMILKPVWRSMSLAANAVGPEFWLVSMLVSLLALLGAVRLAAGTAVEKGVRRVSLLF